MTTTEQKTFRIQRTFDAPREKVWQAWADPKQFEKWWGPVGMPVTLIHTDFREGGRYLYRADGKMGTLWGLFRYLKIERPSAMEYISSFSNEKGEVTKGPFPIDFPLEVFNRVTFIEREGRTTLTLEGHPINATPEQEAVHAQMHDSMKQGFGGTLDQLEAYLKEIRNP
jgi:uncharacterized protein YndB with AHSA1/START domain